MSEQRLVIIGASSGGLEAMLQLLPALTQDYGVPIILVLHQRANRTSGVPEMLARHTHLTVLEPDDKQPIEPGCLYVAPPNYHLLIEKEKIISLSNEAPVNYSRPSIDVAFESAALAYGSDLVALVLSGANQDGVAGALQVKQRGGRVYVQSVVEAQVDVMPAAVVSSVPVDGQLALRELAGILNDLCRSGASP